MAKKKTSKSKSPGVKGKGKPTGPAVKVEKPILSAADCYKRIWRSLYAVQHYLQTHEEPTPELLEKVADGDENAIAKLAEMGEFAPDQLVVPWNQMRELVHCCVMATHGNPTKEDANERIVEEIGTMEEPKQETFSKADVEAFVDAIPGKWLTHYKLPKQNGPTRREAMRFFLQELAENITDDEPPNKLLDPSKVLMMVATADEPTLLSNPVDTFISVPPPKRYPPVIEVLWRHLTEGGSAGGRGTSSSHTRGGVAKTIGIEQFRVFFTWFYMLHFDEVSVDRAEAAALSVFYEWRNEKGQMDMQCFQLAVEHICRAMARQRDTIPYMQKCVDATEAGHMGKGGPVGGLLFFQMPQLVNSSQFPRRVEFDPHQLYISPEIRRWRQDMETYQHNVSRNRIIVHGRRSVGKTKAGRALAKALHCIHLDVVELASTAMKKDTALGKKIQQLYNDDIPIPLDVQSALIREVVCGQTVRYRGYVLSDSLLYTAGTTDALSKFYEACGVVTECLPTVFLEVTCEEGALAQHASRVQVADEDEFRAESDRRAEEKRLAAEAQAREARRVELEERLQDLQEQVDAIEPPEDPEAEVSEAVVELQQEIKSVQHDLGKIQEANTAEHARLAALNNAEPNELARRAAYQNETYLRHLIHLGRRDLITDSGEPLHLTQLPCMKRIIDVAKVANHSEIYSVDGTSSEEDIASYLMHAAGLVAPLIPEEPVIEDGGRLPETVDGDAERGRQKEQAALSGGAEPSLTWKRFCPVTFYDEVLLLEGSPCYSCVFEGRFYCMASQEKLEKFIGNPHLYLSQKPVHRHQMFLIADAKLTKSKKFSLSSFADKLSSTFFLHRMPFEQYYSGLQERREQQQRREAVYQKRIEYEKEERELREDRMTKRILAEMKMKKKAPKKPAKRRSISGKAGKGKGGSPAAEEPVEEPVKEEEEEVEEAVAPERLEDVIGSTLEKAKEERRNAVPILLELLNGQVDLKQLDLLMNEGVLPENIIFLQSVLPDGTVEEEPVEVEEPLTVVEGMEGSAPLGEEPGEQLVGPDGQPQEVLSRSTSATGSGAKMPLEVSASSAPLLGGGLLAATDGEEPLKKDHPEETAAESSKADEDSQASSAGAGKGSKKKRVAAAKAAAAKALQEQADAEAAQADAEVEEDEEVPAADTIEVCLEQLSTPRKEWKLPPGAVSQHYVVSRVNVFNKSEDLIIQELEVRMNPAIATVENGLVDEELGADADEEEEEEEEDDDDDADFPPPKLEPIEKEVRPVRRFEHQFGSRLMYCPVSLVERGLLVRGKNEICAKYMDELYCFVSEEYKAKFEANPMLYIGDLPPRDIPPRLWLVGPKHCGKKRLAAGLQKAYGVPWFEYSRKFLEDVIEAAESPKGKQVGEIFIPPLNPAENSYLARGSALLREVREFAESQATKLKQREEAEEIMAQREEREEMDDEEEEEEEEAPIDEELEARLQEWLEFEPEDEEDKMVRLNEAYLRIAGCVTRLEPFESKGYIMIFPPVAEADLDFIFEEGGIPELVVDVQVTPETLQARSAPFLSDAEKAQQEGGAADGGDGGAEDNSKNGGKATMSDQEWERLCKRKERQLRRWRRRHIGANDPASDEEPNGEDGKGSDGDNANEDEDDDGKGGLGEEDPEELREEFLEGLEDRRVKMIKVRNDLEAGAALNAAKEKLAAHLEHRLSLFCAPQVVFYDNAVKMLKSGRARPSIFDREDPVLLQDQLAGARRRNHWKKHGLAMMEEEDRAALAAAKAKRRSGSRERSGNRGEDADEDDDEDDEDDDDSAAAGGLQNDGDGGEDEEMSELESGDLEEMRERLERRRMRVWRRKAPRTALLYGRLYFFETDESLKKFLHNPLQYLEQPPLLPAMKQSPVVAIFEDDVFFQDESDGEKKRGIAESVAENLGYLFISVPKLLSWAALHPILGDLSMRAIQSALNTEVNDALIEKLLVARLASADVKDQGAVLLNLPRTVQQYEALLANGCAPIVKVANFALGGFHERASLLKEWSAPVVEEIEKHALVQLPVAVPGEPWSNANLNETVRHVDEFVRHEREAILRSRRAYPINMDNSYHTWEHILSHLSEYQWYCPYCWVNHSDLVYVRNHKPTLAAIYLGRYYFFSHRSYLQRFLRNPTEVADPSRMRPLPPHLPEPVNDKTITVDQLELQGCCPVVLYDTRERTGLRGVLEPRATLGSTNFIVRYAGKLYALLNRENRTRFLMCPWVYVEGSFMPPPRKCPLKADEVKNGISDEYFIRRRLYDSVAYAMLAAASLRPQYPGLTIEESTLKYIALHMKANNEESNSIQLEQYRSNLELYEQRATLYKGFADTDVEFPGNREKVDELCEVYDRMIQIQNRLDSLGRLKTSEARSNLSMLVEGVKSMSLHHNSPTMSISMAANTSQSLGAFPSC